MRNAVLPRINVSDRASHAHQRTIGFRRRRGRLLGRKTAGASFCAFQKRTMLPRTFSRTNQISAALPATGTTAETAFGPTSSACRKTWKIREPRQGRQTTFVPGTRNASAEHSSRGEDDRSSIAVGEPAFYAAGHMLRDTQTPHCRQGGSCRHYVPFSVRAEDMHTLEAMP